MKSNLFFLICIILLNYRVNLIGSISITELYIITQIPKLWKWSKTLDFPIFSKILKLFVLLILSQVLSEIIIQNTFTNALKGIMITVMALFIFLFMMKEILEEKASIIMIPLGMLIAQLIFGDQFGFAEEGDKSVWFKFYIVPIVMNGACILFLAGKRRTNTFIILIFLLSGLFMMIGGSRTGGFTMLMSMALYIASTRKHQLSSWKILKLLIPVLLIFQLFYAFIYVPKVKSGEWGSEQNRVQMAAIDYSPNSLMLIMAARSDFYVSSIAFMDAPLFGHGAWAKDNTLKYAYLNATLSDTDYSKVLRSSEVVGIPQVPMHSILVGMGTRNGIISFVLFFIIAFWVYKLSFKVLSFRTKYQAFVCYLIVVSLQAVLFSPHAILKNLVVVFWAVLFSIYYLNSRYGQNEV